MQISSLVCLSFTYKALNREAKPVDVQTVNHTQEHYSDGQMIEQNFLCVIFDLLAKAV